MNIYQTIKFMGQVLAGVFAGGLFRAALEVTKYNGVAQTRAGSLCNLDWMVELLDKKIKFKLIT